MSDKPDGSWRWTRAILFATCLPAIYLGIYFSQVRPEHYRAEYGLHDWEDIPDHTDAVYRMPFGPTEMWEWLFRPANAIDRKARPEIWKGE